MASTPGVYKLTQSESAALKYYLSECPYKQPIGQKGLNLTFYEWNESDLIRQITARCYLDRGSMPSTDQIRRCAEKLLRPLT